jgi:peptidoglycan/LPS O-acetylase OafA/YrhL
MIPSAPPASRANGLDALRASAIALVFMNHYQAFVSREPTFGWGSTIGWAGVDLFFVLSGYLIANQLFAGIAREQTLSPGSFYGRRALRTLPVFWVVLALYFLFPAAMGGDTPPPLWRFLTFTQNIRLHSGTAFSHAWSLCIEEQFYLVLPLVLVAGARLGCGRSQGWALLLGLILVGIVTRSVLWMSYGANQGGYYQHIYYQTECRFDEFLPGVAVAMLKNFHRPLWERIISRGHRNLAIGAVATLVMLTLAYNFKEVDGYGYPYFMTGFGYSLLAVAFALLVVAALSPGSWLYRLRIPGAYHIALWSYSTYLSHKALDIILNRHMGHLGLPPGALPAIILATCLSAGAALYYLIEAPFMRLRDRLIPTNFPAYNQPWLASLSQARPTD